VTGPSAPIRFSRRRLLVASSATLAAGAPLAMTACGAAEEADTSSPEREAELLNEVLAGQLAVVEALQAATGGAPKKTQAVILSLFAKRQKSTKGLGALIRELDGTPTEAAAESIAAESAVEAATRQLEASIATSLDAIGELTTDAYRQAVHRAITEDAATLAALRDTLGEDPAPEAFVMGPAVRPEAE